MKNFIIALSLILSLQVSAKAAASVAPALEGTAGSHVSGTLAQSLVYIGAPVYRIEVSTPADTPVLLLAGQGLLYSVQCSSGLTGSYFLGFDSATASGITIATSGKAITPQVFSGGQIQVLSSSQTVVLTSQSGLNMQDNPAPFNNGLVGIVHGSVANCLIKARLNTGANPGP